VCVFVFFNFFFFFQKKDESRTDPERHSAIQDLLGAISDRQYHDLVEIGKRITDYHDVGGRDGADAVLGENIPVVFEDDDADNAGEGFEIKDASSDASDDGEEAGMGTALGGKADLRGDEDAMMVDAGTVPAAQIDAYWMQRQVSVFCSDASKAQALAERLLVILREEQNDATACENKLVELLEFDQFDFVRLLMHNRYVIVWTTLYRRAKDEKERRQIEEQMEAQEHLLPIIDELRGKQQKKKKASAAVPGAGAAATTDTGGVMPMDQEEDENVPAHWKIARKVLDLEQLAFYEGGRFMANKTVVLPPGTQRIPHKGYEEVQIPPPERPPPSQQPKLVPIEELPGWAQEVFNPRAKEGEKPKTGIKFLNPLQSAVFQKAFFSADNLLIAAPTGSGKTNTAMLCILHEIGLNRRADGTIDLDAFKIVYIAPMKSLVQEMVLNFGKRLACLGITVKELSGDQNLNKQQISQTQIIVTTPEKWDVVTRRSGDRSFTQLVRLIIIDEVHLLHDDRGPVLEAVIARSNRQVEETQQMIRLVGLSATLPNYEDVAMLLRVEESGIFHFGNAHRPVPLELTFVGVESKKAVQRFKLINEVCYEQVMSRAGKHQIIIFW
jgi:pre-mRNA-splicing helicase BRR2